MAGPPLRWSGTHCLHDILRNPDISRDRFKRLGKSTVSGGQGVGMPDSDFKHKNVLRELRSISVRTIFGSVSALCFKNFPLFCTSETLFCLHQYTYSHTIWQVKIKLLAIKRA